MTHIDVVSPNPSVPVTRIRGALGEKVLRKSPELFNQSLPTVLAEVLQNSRRAGATRVEIEANEENPGYYTGKFMFVPHYQLEGMDIALSMVSRLPKSNG